jgi:hypothetical protein
MMKAVEYASAQALQKTKWLIVNHVGESSALPELHSVAGLERNG